MCTQPICSELEPRAVTAIRRQFLPRNAQKGRHVLYVLGTPWRGQVLDP